jgi:hypothetical protein
MANRYWVGGAGTWDESSTTNWSTSSGGGGGASVPTAADDVYFDANSGSGTVSLPYIGTAITSAGRRCQNLDVGNISATLVFSNTDISYYDAAGFYSLGNNIAVWGTSLIVSGRTYTSGYPHPGVIGAGSGTLTVQATTTGGAYGYGFGLGVLGNKNLTFSGSNRMEVRNAPYVYSGTTIDTGTGAGPVSIGFYIQGGTFNARSNWIPGFTQMVFSGTFNLLAAPYAGAGIGLSQYGGTFSTSLSTVPITSFNVSGGTVNYASTTFAGLSSAGGVWQIDPSATLSGTSLSVTNVSTFIGGGRNYANVTLGGGSGNRFTSGLLSNLNSSGNPQGTITTLTVGTGHNCSMLIYLPNNITAGSINLNAQASPALITYIGIGNAGASTLSSSSVSNVNRVNFCNITFTVSISGSDVGDGGGNTNITFSTPKTLYISQASGAYLSSNIYATSSGGVPSTSNIPLAHDTIIFDSNSTNPGSYLSFYEGVLGNFTCTSAPANTTFYFYGINQTGFFGNFTINASNVIAMNNEVPLWGKGSTATTVNITNTSSSRRGPDLSFYSGTHTLNGPFVANNSIGTAQGSLTLQSGTTFDAGQLQIASAPSYHSFRNLTFTLNMAGATLSLGRYTSGGNLATYQNYSYSSFNVTSNASSTIELWDGTSGTTKDVNFPNSSSVFPKMVFRGSNASMTYRFSNSSGSYSYPEIEELATQRSTATSFTINGSLDSSYSLRVKKWSINGVSGTNVVVTSRFQYTGTGNAVGEYLTVSNSTATPASTWYAVNSTNSGGNSGWTFSAPSSGNGLLFGSNF